ncbi:hypothetical protein [Natronomonas sp. LN261]|jgi:hypothetical protein|nr:hypothetical protein [Natronomonas sp. LN261]
MKEDNMELLYEECSNGNDRACYTLEQLCEDGLDKACQRVSN